ncbi:hypothetical protein D3C71_79750 [compost metagenome]
MSKTVRFASTEDAMEIICTLQPAHQAEVLKAYNDAAAQLMALPNYSPESNGITAKIAVVRVDTTFMGANGRACVSWLFEAGGFKVHMESQKDVIDRGVGNDGKRNIYNGTMTDIVLGW